jgi:ribosomal-protein-alanine N-acetyltransferase
MSAKKINLRPARPADADAILAIEHSSFDHPAEKFHARQIRSLVANPRAIVLVARGSTGEVLGWAAALVRRAGASVSGRYYALAVHPHGRGLGIGRSLSERILAELRRRGAKRIYLEVRADNLLAIGLYERLGFRRHQNLRHYYAKGRHGLRMVLQ